MDRTIQLKKCQFKQPDIESRWDICFIKYFPNGCSLNRLDHSPWSFAFLLKFRLCIVDTENHFTAAKMPTLDDIIEGATNKSKRQLQEALLGLLKGNPDILDLVTKSKTKTLQDKNEIVSLFLWLYITIRNTKSLSFRKALPWNFYKGILLIASVCIFSIMVFIHFLWYRQGEYD